VNHPAARTENIRVAWRDALVGSAFAVIMQVIGDVEPGFCVVGFS